MNGTFILILGPSGTGKGTVISHLRTVFPDAVFPLSCTTRLARPGEKDGQVYHFITKEDFKARIDSGDFLEWAIVHNDNYYGTLKAPIEGALREGKSVIREVDMQGVMSIRKIFGRENVKAIFITSPSWESLRARIEKRAPLSAEELDHREKSFEKEMVFSKECDFVVMSEDGKIPEVCAEVEGIIREVSGCRNSPSPSQNVA